jgi:hypothetical protein
MPSATDRPTKEDLKTNFAMHVDTFGFDAVDMVVGGYYTILAAFKQAKERGLIPKGRMITEMIGSSRWHMPDLLTAAQFEAFQDETTLSNVTEVMHAIRFILKSICDERRLMPSVVMDLKTEALYVQLRA